MAIPMLRGTIKNYRKREYPTSRPLSLQNKVARLERRVARTFPEKRTFTYSVTSTPGSSGWHNLDQNITTQLINWSLFRDYVNGDKWINNYLKFRTVSFGNQCLCARLVVYLPRKANTSVSWSGTATDMSYIFDPSSFTVLYDRQFRKGFNSDNVIGDGYVSLRNMVTTYNSEVPSIEKGDIRMAYIFNLTTAENQEIVWQLGFQDK